MTKAEIIALTYDDFDEFANGKMGGSVTKSYNSAYKLLKGTKNDKTRKIPLPKDVIELYVPILQEHLKKGEKTEARVFTCDHGVCNVMIKKACREVKIREYNCHSFRHTYISNLIRGCVPISVIEQVSGDTQATILKRYSHMFEGDENLVLEAMERVKWSCAGL